MLKTAIVGASGYAGNELIRLVTNHPELELVTVTANSEVGQRVASDFTGISDLVFKETTPENLAGHDVVFIALPHTKSAEVASWLDAETLVLDCGADFRLESATEYEKFYQAKHPGTWVYGMPELQIAKGKKQRDLLIGAKQIAVPGCNATAVSLAFAPLVIAELIEVSDLVSTLSVGTSGAGKNAEVNKVGLKSAYAYQVGGVHRHIPEIIQNLTKSRQADVGLTFTPVLVPMFRGILAVNSARLRPGVGIEEVRQAFEDCYGSESFVTLRPNGSFPNTLDTEMVNRFELGVTLDANSNRVVVVSALDNLVKGTAGAAIQSMNIALGFKEDTGLV